MIFLYVSVTVVLNWFVIDSSSSSIKQSGANFLHIISLKFPATMGSFSFSRSESSVLFSPNLLQTKLKVYHYHAMVASHIRTKKDPCLNLVHV